MKKKCNSCIKYIVSSVIAFQLIIGSSSSYFIEEYSEDIDGNEMIYNTTLIEEKMQLLYKIHNCYCFY